ncbi:uncharacterized protein LOC122216321 isoform X2 [Panthera leo]|uniref:uncharacterized protein LOC122216321 isoform X2 n=1 Tax=Panthera leo TaxID=9689 RepID=UPI001C699BC5|nr:uncharacterized protein LOC122216321 isoform X2 [Panthera leo]
MQLEPLLWIQGKKHLLDKGISEANMATPQAVDYSRIFGVHDSLQMVWVLNGNSLITTPFNNNVSPVSLDLMTCMDKEFHDAGKGNPVYLGIKNNCLCLFCGEVQGQPTLQLKVMNSARRLTQCETSHCRPDKARPRGIYFLYHRTEATESGSSPSCSVDRGPAMAKPHNLWEVSPQTLGGLRSTDEQSTWTCFGGSHHDLSSHLTSQNLVSTPPS